ncbi:TonB-dependent receptor family protein [Maricaulis sp.]|uniref:TonB-dependent receptor family protein n=1 Tax=Maricaulis sp. TaxID=1486257 RepID=UPI003A8F27AF
MRRTLLSATALVAISMPAWAQEVAQAASHADVIAVIGLGGDPNSVPGSAALLDADDLAVHDYPDITRLLRTVAGVNIQEEDGYGLRPNIGMRGTGLDRSEKITLMEDGVLISPAPYAAPAAYYFPHAGRMAGVEVIKGAAGVRYGPRTQGGSLNLLSTPVPDEFSGQIGVWAGDEGILRGHGFAGGMSQAGTGLRVGGLLEAYLDSADGFKTIDGFEDASTGYEIEDYVGKLRFEFDAGGIAHMFELKGQYSDELSNETYLGLTEADFAADPFRRYAGSQMDAMDAQHSELSLRYRGELENGLVFSAVAYSTEFSRDWFKLDSVDPDGAGAAGSVSIAALLDDPVTHADAFETVLGASGFVSADDALRVKHNNREYAAQGAQFELAGDMTMARADHAWRIGVRAHRDEMDRYQWVERFRMDDGEMVQTSVDVPGSDSNRIESAEALAVFVQDEISFGNWMLTPGLRYERVELRREDFGKLDPDRTGANLAIRTNTVEALIPGIGLRHDIDAHLSVFAGVHRGFAPPAPGSTTQEAEDATNWEVGARYGRENWQVEAIGFFNGYENLIGSCTNSTGGGCTVGDQFDGGEVDVRGLELTGDADLGPAFGFGFSVPLRAAYTWTEAEFQTAFNSGYEPWSMVLAGDLVPYIPEQQVFAAIGIETERFGGELALSWVGEVRTQAGQGAIPGDERIESHTVADFSAWYAFTDQVRARLSVRNLTDETYAVARQPAGLRPGAPRAILVGLSASF